ncbi:MAG TPA: hypothetical protein DC063_00195 [Arenimonas sp.]|nr:hypothetical protein [Arenimonas sp.]
MEVKPAIKSKTIDFNAVMLAVAGVLAGFGVDVPDYVYQALLAAVPLANIVLRFVTKGGIAIMGGKATN